MGAEVINFEMDTDLSAKINTLSLGELDRSIDDAGFRYAKRLIHKVERAVDLGTDTSKITNEMVCSTKKFGTIALNADYSAYAKHLLITGIMEKGTRLIGCGHDPIQRHWAKCLEHIRSRKFDPPIILTHGFTLEETVEGYKGFDLKQAGITKGFSSLRSVVHQRQALPVSLLSRKLEVFFKSDVHNLCAVLNKND